MKIDLNQPNVVVNYVLSGAYSQPVLNNRGKVYEFSSPKNPISNFKFPYDAKLVNETFDGTELIAAGERKRASCPPTKDRTGILYFAQKLNLVGACHGLGASQLTYYQGFNYYNSFYPAGYASPPFGENISVFNANLGGYDSLQNGSCNSLTVTEYNEQFGIVSKSATNASYLTNTLVESIYSPIYSPAESCPPDIVSQSYYDEVNFSQIPGNTLALGGNNNFNGNPIPTSLDNFDIKINGRYSITTDENGINTVLFTGGRPISSYGMGNEQNKLNNTLCPASLMETRVGMGKGSNGAQLINSPDVLYGAAGEQVNFAGSDPFYYWHFTFRENANGLPFSNNFVSKGNTTQRVRFLSEGTPLFIPILSSEESYWKNRQCPDTVDYLPWTFGASIYACPSEHFDIPYYAAVRKFGFYGARFLNTCKALNLDYELSGATDAIELPTGNSNLVLGAGEIEPDDLDKGGAWSFSSYNNLLKVAKAEENYSNMYALNKAFFLWANSGEIVSGQDYLALSGQNLSFIPQFTSLIKKFQNVFESGIASFTGNEPNIFLSQSFNLISSGQFYEILATNKEFQTFKIKLEEILTENDWPYWNNIEKNYTNFVSLNGEINQNYYQAIISGREKRLTTRYFENVLRGNAIDLFPLNNITFSFDKAKDYIEHTGWGRRVASFGKNSSLPEIQRRYFEGAYGNASASYSLSNALSIFSGTDVDYYYPGFFQNVQLSKEVPKPTYVSAVSGFIVDESGRSFSPSGWLALGYNEIGALDGNFSCFTPIFVQQPIPKVFCKIGQKPTFRALAVDYHTLPEDKISRKYPEIIYWASKLKMLDCVGNYLYPLKYKWYRIPKTDYEQYLPSGNFFNFASPSNPTGDWACLEGDKSNCTVFHPNESYPVYSGTQSEDNYTFIKGAKNSDADYYYICLTSGRFGIRRSNVSELNVENWLSFDVSVKNGLNMASSLTLDFTVNDYQGNNQTISFAQEKSLANYGGYQQDLYTVPETIIEMKAPPPNAGWGDVHAFRFVGPMGYIGATRSYKPSVLTDTRGLRETWGHMLEYGQLVSFYKELSQEHGDLLYGYKHLPTCENYEMPNGKKGIKLSAKFNGYKIGHWTLPQKAVASLDNKAGIQWNKLLNHGELYPPINSKDESPHFGIGHWQWGNNLGAIKRFGKFSNYGSKDITFVGQGTNNVGQGNGNQMIQKIQEKLIGPTDLAGENCGYVENGIGRNMLYYIEAYERFYIFCDPLKKKNVTNRSFLAPGLRFANSALQYFWLGKPTNTYLKRRSMYGPYAYQWRVEKHNRDRHGNGISEALYSMGHGKKYDLLYDAPATYGLYVKTKTNGNYKASLKDLEEKRNNIRAGQILSPLNIRNTWFGERGNEGTSRRYGSISYSCDPSVNGYDPNVCDYVGAARSVASNIDFSDHLCPQDVLSEGNCFNSCLSLRYGQGFFPGGKSMDLMGINTNSNDNLNETKNIKIVPIARLRNDTPVVSDENAENSETVAFRSPINTPHARRNLALGNFIGGIVPCQDGGADHCNYITPTVHLGAANYLIGNTNIFNDMRAFAASIYGGS